MDLSHDLANPTLVWFLVGLLMFVLELVSPGMIIFFFGFGAWVVSILCYFLALDINQQLFLFIIISGVTLVLARRWLKSLFLGFVKSRQNPQEDLEDFVGKKAEVKEKIFSGKTGKIEFNGTLWSAESDDEIEAGCRVQIVSKENLVLKVRKL